MTLLHLEFVQRTASLAANTVSHFKTMDLKHSEENVGGSGDYSVGGKARVGEAAVVGLTGFFPPQRELRVLLKLLLMLASFGVSPRVHHVRHLSFSSAFGGSEERCFYLKLLHQKTVKSVLPSPRKQQSDVDGKESDVFIKV